MWNKIFKNWDCCQNKKRITFFIELSKCDVGLFDGQSNPLFESCVRWFNAFFRSEKRRSIISFQNTTQHLEINLFYTYYLHESTLLTKKQCLGTRNFDQSIFTYSEARNDKQCSGAENWKTKLMHSGWKRFTIFLISSNEVKTRWETYE